MKHDICLHMSWCKCCGRSYEEIINSNIVECDGLPGVVHANYTRAKEFMTKTFEPVVDKILDNLDRGT